jgi:hypothetical protein
MTNKRGGAAVNKKDEAAVNERDELDGYFHHIDVPEISHDLVIGAEQIATWLFGAPERRRLYHLAESTKLPTTNVGSKIAIQKSVVRAFFWAKQSRAFANDNIEELIRLRLLLLKLLELLRPANAGMVLDTNLDYVQISFALIEISRAIKVLTSAPR